ncbi:MAG TPA: gamma-glutamyl-gamma-aminobutyrate hydrolase family protein [Kofleriaceae bacterium]|nr:gamma-glutamyl-gamma-aminobutyrate hydrolase family protein [Kofleriaceae bacterium]
MRQFRQPGVTPLIAVTTSEIRDRKPETDVQDGQPPQHEMALGLKYLHATEAAGGLPMVVPPLGAAAVAPLLDRCSGLLLSGGPDLDPTAYNERAHAETGPVEPHLDAFELQLARMAIARRMPIFAICRGMQLLNVARGGTLHQHLPDLVGDAVQHRQTEPGGRPTHWVRFRPDSQVARLMGRKRTKVNSLHHQAIDRLGSGLVATAWAADGTIEAVEATDRDFVFGVQWHAECLVGRPEQAALFGAFVEAAAAYERPAATPLEAAA